MNLPLEKYIPIMPYMFLSIPEGPLFATVIKERVDGASGLGE
jgi:hypothetical protein